MISIKVGDILRCAIKSAMPIAIIFTDAVVKSVHNGYIIDTRGRVIKNEYILYVIE